MRRLQLRRALLTDPLQLPDTRVRLEQEVPAFREAWLGYLHHCLARQEQCYGC